MRLPRFRLRTLMISIAFLALILTVIMQAILLRRGAAREQQLRAEIESQKLQAALQGMQAEAAEYRRKAEAAEYRRTLAIVKEQRTTPPAAPKP